MTFDRLTLWRDRVPRPGPENMAIDEWLLETAREPVLRVYAWEGDWLSVGYFGQIAEARALSREAGLVRRATGGGIVDHRVDRTYTLVVPRDEEMARTKGAESYRVVHAALAKALAEAGFANRLVGSGEEGEEDSALCFEKPVAWDIVDAAGRKMAGAGQRRTRRGLLHQGSVVIPDERAGLFRALAGRLAAKVETKDREPPGGELAVLLEKFSARSWLERR